MSLMRWICKSLAPSFFVLLSVPALATAATVTTDRPDYPPGDSVYISGSGFLAGEIVTVQVDHFEEPSMGEGHDPWNVVADGFGNFETYWVVPFDDNVGVVLVVTADGQSSGWHAEAIFTDANTVLELSGVPDSICAGDTLTVCATLTQSCAGGAEAPLENRAVLFFINPGNCGANVGQNANDTVFTDENGVACSDLAIPGTPGQYSIRVKFLGEDKPSPCPMPGNSACNPNDPNDNKRCVELSNSNDCDIVQVVESIDPTATCPGDTTITVCDLSEICLPGFDCSGDSVEVIGGTLSGNSVCFTPVQGVNTIVLNCYSFCGTDACTTNVTVNLVPTATASCPADMDLFVCDLSPICIPGFAYTNGTPTVIGGTLSGDEVCFTPAEGTNTITLIVTDECGRADTCTTTVNVTLNSPPVAACPGDQTMTVCDLSEICLEGFTCSDPDGNCSSAIAIGGTLTGETVCFTPVEGDNTITFICTDECGEADTCVTVISVTLRQPPVASCPGDTSLLVCDLSEICLPGFSYSGGTPTVIGGTLDGNSVCFTPVPGLNTITLICSNECGADTCETVVDVTLNQPPVVSCPNDTTIFVCELSEICLPGFSYSDPDGNGLTPVVIGGTLTGNTVCFTPVEGINTITLVKADECGAADTCTTVVTVALNRPPVVSCPNDTSLFVCDLEEICLPGFSYSDPDGNGLNPVVIGGRLVGNSVCFTPVEGTNTITLIKADACGEADTCTTIVTVTLNSPPVVTCPNDTDLFLCEVEEICLPGFTYSDPDGNGLTPTVIGGTLTGNTVCFNPVEGANTITLIKADECGAADTCTTVVNVTLNNAPVVSCPSDAAFTLCGPEEVCVGPFECTDEENNVVSSGPLFGTLDGDQVCFTPDTAGVYAITYVCTDECGAADTCVTNVTIDYVPAPEIADMTYDIVLCDAENVCLELPAVTGGAAPYTWTSSCGEVVGDQFCLAITADGQITCDIAVTDSCGRTDQASLTINATVNDKPIVTIDPPSELFLCEAGEVCVKLTILDPDNHLTGTSQIGTVNLEDSTVCFTADESGTYCDQVIIRDSCGLADTVNYCIDITINTPPTVTCANDSMVFLCDVREGICLSPFSAVDPDDNIVSETVSWGTLAGGEVCFVPDTTGTYVIEYIATDECGAADTCVTTLYVNQPRLAIDTTTAIQGTSVDICVRVEGMSFPWGGFDFLINYDPVLLAFQEAVPGDFLVNCEWEYFTYRLVSTNPGLVRLVAIADMNNSNIHPECLTPQDGDIIACLRFRVTNDRQYACQSALLNFWWTDCGDNSIADPTGNILYIAGEGGLTVTNAYGEDLTGLASVGGPPYPCPSDKYVPLPCVEFEGGKIRLICPGEIDDRGDLNLNAVAYEIADAVLYSQYFVDGPGALKINYDGQVAASDVNADGIPLTVADLVYLIRVITGDATPIMEDLLGGGPKVAGIVGTLQVEAELVGSNVTVSTRSDHEVGAGLFVFRYSGLQIADVSLVGRASAMSATYSARGGELRVLVHDLDDRDRIVAGAGDVLSIRTVGSGWIELVGVEAATFMGGGLETQFKAGVRPTSFALLQNLPNPFNPSTSLSADFPQASDYTLTIYNIAGQVVKTFAGHTEAGRLAVTWDGTNERGQQVASGVYFYALKAGDFSAVRKMMLMK